MMPGQGMGAAGTGAGQTPMMPQGVNPQLLQMLMQMGSQAPGLPAVQGAPGPMAASPQGSPMSNYIGAGGNMAGMMNHPMGMPQNPAMAGGPGVGANPGQAAAINPNMLALIQAMRGGQTGVTGATGAAGSMPALGYGGVPAGMPNLAQLQQMGGSMSNPQY